MFVLVVSHEFGHFIVAKKSGMRVDEFSFGFPPKLFGFKKGETQYNFNLLPLGGYVKIYGENGETEENKDFSKDDITITETVTEKIITETKSSSIGTSSIKIETLEDNIEITNNNFESRSFKSKPLWSQALVLCAGVTMNFLLAWVLLSVGFISGLPSSVSQAPEGYSVSNQALTITSVVPNSPALKSGLKVGDKIVSLNTKTDSTLLLSSIFGADSVKNFIKAHGSEEISVSILRAKDAMDITVTPEKNDNSDSAMIGISMDTIGTLKLPLHKALWEGLKLSSSLFTSTVSGFYTLIRDGITGHGNIAALSGPVGIVGVVGDAAKFGFVYLLSFTALISINLAVINLIPFPALDGGQLLFLLIEKIKGSRINPKVANIVNMIGFGILMLLMIVITYHDIVKLL